MDDAPNTNVPRRFIVRFMALVSGVTVILFWLYFMTVSPMSDAAQGDVDFDHLDWNEPVFTSTTQEPVLLRHQLKTGDVLGFLMDSTAKIQIESSGGDRNSGMHVTQALQCEVADNSPDGESNLTVSYDRFAMSDGDEIIFNSEDLDHTNDPSFSNLTSLLAFSIPLKISNVGKILPLDEDVRRTAIQQIGSEDRFDQIDRGATRLANVFFLPLPTPPIRQDYVYKVGEVRFENSFSSRGVITVDLGYRLHSIRADGQQVLIHPVGNVVSMDTSAAFQKANLKLESIEGNVGGWILFSVAEGRVLRAKEVVSMTYVLTHDGAPIVTTMTLTNRLIARRDTNADEMP